MAESGSSVTLEEASAMIRKHDKNGSGTIGFDEFAVVTDYMDGDDFLAWGPSLSFEAFHMGDASQTTQSRTWALESPVSL